MSRAPQPLIPMRMLHGDGYVTPLAVIAADLLEAGDARSTRAAHRLLEAG